MSVFDTKDETGLYTEEDVSSNKVVCIFGYFGFLFFIPLVAAPESPYAKFHANQGFVLFIAELIIGVASGMFAACGMLPLLGFVFMIMSSVISSAGGFAALLLLIFGIINVSQGRAKELPVIGRFRLLK